MSHLPTTIAIVNDTLFFMVFSNFLLLLERNIIDFIK